MEVKAISTPNFEGHKNNKIQNKKHSVGNDYPQMSAPASQNTSNAMRNISMRYHL